MSRCVFLLTIILNFAAWFVFVPQAFSFQLSGYAEVEGRLFFHDPLYEGQEENDVSFAVTPEFYFKEETGPSLTLTPFIRVDSADSRRSHFDIREFNYQWVFDSWELKVGISKVFWGATEFLHLVDIINQTDLVESIDGEEKLGQPMVHISVPRDWGVVDFFILPYFRERTFPGEKGRLRAPFVVDTDSAVYESSDGENHIDFALRYSRTLGDWDFGIYHFKGTGREPSIKAAFKSGRIVLIPEYRLIDQTGLDLQGVKGNLLLKLESLYRSGQGDSFYAATGGFEYSFYNIISSSADLGLLMEWAYDERGRDSTTGFDNDVMVGTRLTFNDIAGTEMLAGLITGVDNEDRILSFESSRRLNDSWKIKVNSYIVISSSQESIINSLRDDDYVQIELRRYF